MRYEVERWCNMYATIFWYIIYSIQELVAGIFGLKRGGLFEWSSWWSWCFSSSFWSFNFILLFWTAKMKFLWTSFFGASNSYTLTLILPVCLLNWTSTCSATSGNSPSRASASSRSFLSIAATSILSKALSLALTP